MRTFYFALAALVLPVLVEAQAPTKLPAASVWDVEWRDPEGHFYSGELQLQVLGGKVQGFFTWTLRASPSAEEQAKLGLTGTEHITGSYDSDCGILTFEGYRLEDPNGILGMDQYRLVVDPDGMRVGGLTSHGATWMGELKGGRR